MTLAVAPPGLQKPAPWGIVPGLVDPKWRGMWDGLVGLWMFWEGGGSPIDLMGRSTLNTAAAASTWAHGPPGSHLYLVPSNYITYDTNLDLSARYSVGIVVEADSGASWDSWGGMFTKETSGGAAQATIQRNSGSDNILAFHEGGSPDRLDILVDIAELVGGVHSIVTTYDGTNLRSYFDGAARQNGAIGTPGSGAGAIRINADKSGGSEASARYYLLAIWQRLLSDAEAVLFTLDPFGLARMAGVPVWKAPAVGGDVFGVLALSAAGTLGLVAAKEAAGVLALTASGTLTVVPIAELAGVLALNGIATLSASPLAVAIEPPHVSDLLDLQTVLGPKITVITVASELTDVQTVISEELEASP